MPIWSRLINIRYAIVDVEVGLKNHKIHDIGALRHDGANIYSQTKHANGFWSTRFIYLLCCFRNVLTISL